MNPPRKSKPGKIRPVIALQSSDTLEIGSPGVVVIPCTSQHREQNILRFQITPHVGLDLEKPSDVLLDQIHTIDRTLFMKELGPVIPEDWKKIMDGVRFLLGF
jgi:mRNA-degrading endonuclease toxin of MazEF toxin-antitoxin module